MYSNYSIAVFDFDRTLCSHEYFDSYDIAEYVNNYIDTRYFPKDKRCLPEKHNMDKPLVCMQRLVNTLSLSGCRFICLSSQPTTFRYNHNVKFLERNYPLPNGFWDYFEVRDDDMKLEFMGALSNSLSTSSMGKILYVDDSMSTIHNLSDMKLDNVDILHISNVYNL